MTDGDIDLELQHHLQERIDSLLDSGLSPREAQREARRRFGNITRYERECRLIARNQERRMQVLEFCRSIAQDILYAARGANSSRTFAAALILTVGLGIGTITAMFSIVNGTLLNPLPFIGGDRLVYVWRQQTDDGVWLTPTRTMVDAWRARSRSLDGLTGYTGRQFVLTSGREPEYIDGTMVSPDFFSFLGIGPKLGRVFVPADANHRVAMLREGFWKQRYGSDPEVIGRSITLDDEPYEIVGVLPSRADQVFNGGDIWVPTTDQDDIGLSVLARLRPGVTPEQAEADMAQAYATLAGLSDEDRAWGPKIVTPQAMIGTDLRTALWMLLGAVGLVLLVVCANVANMLTARGITRGHELAVRASLGATRSRIARQLLTESLLLATLGGALGATLAYVVVPAAMNFLPENLEDLRNVRIEPMVLAFTCIVTLGTGLLFGSAPILQIRSLRLSSVLNQANRTGTAGSRRSAMRQALVGFEVALALVLFLGAGLLLNSLIRLQSADPGFDASNLVTIRLPLSQPAYADSATRQTLLTDVVDRVSQLPGVVSVATGSGVPPRMDMMAGGPVLEGEDPAEVAVSAPPSSIALVAPEYFAALRMRFVDGRGFTEADMLGGSSPMVVNESYARTRWPDVSAVGQRFKLGRGKSWFHVVGVVQDVASTGLGTSRERAQFYFTSHLFGPIGGTSLIVRTTDDPLAMIPRLKQQVWAVDARLPLGDIGLVDRMLSRSIARQRFSALVLSGFAFLSLALAAIGVYGVISLAVNQRTREIGVRVALGAQSADIAKMVVGYGMKPIVWGILLGVAGSLAASRVLRSLLFEVQQTDVPTYVVVTLLLAMVGLTAAYLPSRRAATIDPLEALREE